MKTHIVVLLILTIFEGGCGKEPPHLDANAWSPPQAISHSRDSLGSTFSLYKWNSSLLALNGDTGSLSLYFLNEDEKSWKEKSSSYAGSWSLLDTDAGTNKIVICRGTALGDKLDVNFLYAAIDLNGNLSIIFDKNWHGDKSELFGKTGKNITIYSSDKPAHPVFRRGVVDGSTICIPYSVRGEAYEGNVLVSREAPYAHGIFLSSDSGLSWQREQLSNLEGRYTFICKTRMYWYYFMVSQNENALSFFRKETQGDWSQLATISKTVVAYNAIAEGNCVHLCWLDRRHEKKRLNPVYPNCENYEVAYCHRKDTDDAWSKDVILSEGLLYAYSPSISVEGDKVVVAWAGVKSDKDGRNEWDPSDIYYVTSKDGGKTWTKPLQVTDGFKAGITSGRPQVALHNGIIHLFYIQGKLNYREVSSGAAKLNQPPWPIYYTQRPFPD
jgi:hypothetical protein